ncbi:MAG: DUF6516 family protein [Burkholderiaceae bacterium]|jgi:hypothetical protein|nr:DUF6516 family protein [Burkholderiaceae bacterium]
MLKARLLLCTRTAVHGGSVEMAVWSVPSPLPPSQHAFKYRLVFVRDGQRLVGYDNERGKGDHKHIGGREYKYRFTDIDTLVGDFLRDVEKLA